MSSKTEKTEKNKLSVAQVCIALAGHGGTFWHTPDGEPYVTMKTADGHEEHMYMAGARYKRWLGHQYFTYSGNAPNTQAVVAALEILAYKALEEAPEHPIYKRVARVDGRIYLDLANERWECVEVTADGWSVIPRPPVRFRRGKNMAPLPTPVHGGSAERLREFVRASDDNWLLIKGAVLDALKGRGPFFTVAYHGEQGSAKTWTTKRVKRLVDPVFKAEVSGLPRDVEGFGTDCENEYVLAYDNVSSVNQTQADVLCRVATGGGLKKRKLYEDAGQVAYDFCQPVVLNGIPDFTEANDLLSRSVVIRLDSMRAEDQIEEETLEKRFLAASPEILGGFLDLCARGLRDLDATEIPPKDRPRMLDSARWISACTGDLNWLAAYNENREEGVEVGLEASPLGDLGDVLLAINVDRPGDPRGAFRGTSRGLLDKFRYYYRDHGGERPKALPDNPKALTNRLKRDATALRHKGFVVEFLPKSNGQRLLRIEAPNAPAV